MGKKSKNKQTRFKKGNIPHNKGISYTKESKMSVPIREIKRLTQDEYDLYTTDCAGHTVSLPNVMLLRPRPAKLNAASALAVDTDRRLSLIHI